MASFYGGAGLLHLTWPEPFIRIMPTFLPRPDLLVLLSGLAELVLAAPFCRPAPGGWQPAG